MDEETQNPYPEAQGWDAPARFRRQRALAMSSDERMAVVEEMIQMAIAAGTFRRKGELLPFPPRVPPAKAQV